MRNISNSVWSYVCLPVYMVLLFGTLAEAGGKKGFEIRVFGTDARVNREVMGPPTEHVGGVPAVPVDSFVWDGDGSIPVRGRIKIAIDPVANTGKIVARWHDDHGSWLYKQTTFMPPHHPSGIRIGSSADSEDMFADVEIQEIKDEMTTSQEDESDPVTTNIYLHGDTGSGGPVLPTIFNMLATWGPAKVSLNGTQLVNPYDGPVPLWVGHSMTTEGVRGEDGTVRTTAGTIFNPGVSGQGATEPADMEVHLVFHDAPGPMVGNIPPMFSFFYHVVFEKVRLRVISK